MRFSVRRLVRPSLVVSAAIALSFFVAPTTALSQTGTVSGFVLDTIGNPLPASVSVIGTTLGTYAGSDGSYSMTGVPAGARRIVTHYIGYKSDTTHVTITAGQVSTLRIRLHSEPNALQAVTVTGNRPSFNQSQAAALTQQKNADNIITVMSGDEISQLPNPNAAQALTRLPGVTAEYDEGEGKYVEIRGTPPDFNHVTIDGADIPGTLANDPRAVKLDDVPGSMLGSIEVSKTLTADEPARAIGGSVNLVTKTPEGAPHGEAFGNLGYVTIPGNFQGAAGLTYGGRLGEDQKFGFLLNGSWDQENRVINDVEPGWTAAAPITATPGAYYDVPNGSGFTTAYPNQWSQRYYNYYRQRYGLSGNVDYRVTPTSDFYLKGLWSEFLDEATRWETSLGGGGLTVVDGQQMVGGGGVGYTVANRGPIEQTWAFTGGGTHQLNNVLLTWRASVAQSNANETNHVQDSYNNPASFNFFTNPNKLIPQYTVDMPTQMAIKTAGNYTFGQQALEADHETNPGQNVGGQIDALIKEVIANQPAATKLGVYVDNEHKSYYQNDPTYDYTGENPLGLSSFLQNTQANNGKNPFYGSICSGCYILAPYGSTQAVNNNFTGNPGLWTNSCITGSACNQPGDSLAQFSGTENVIAGYVMQTFNLGTWHFNVGARVENTKVGYFGYTQPDSLNPNALVGVHGTSSYTNFFPSLQIRWAVDDNSNLRFAVTRGIARPDYFQLAPFFQSQGAERNSMTSTLTAGNPALRPEIAWNYDILAEHYFPSVGVLSGGFFYKQITDFIFQRVSAYPGPIEQFAPNDSGSFYVNQYQNGPSAWLYGFEVDYTQHFTSWAGALQGIGFDVNYTYTQSEAKVPIPGYNTDQYDYTNPNTGATISPYATTPFRFAPLDRQIPQMFNASLLYDYSRVSARLGFQWTDANINQYGVDGTSNPASGDNYFYTHFQIDLGVSWNVMNNTTLSVQGWNINNSVFGFFTGTTANQYNTQREYYGPTWSVMIRQGF